MTAAVAIWDEPPFAGPDMNDAVKKPLLAACRFLLQPMVRILLRHGVSYGEFSDAVRAAYIDIAETEILKSEGDKSDSRLAIVTGMPRRDVERIRETGPSTDSQANPNWIARVLQGWSMDPEFLGPYGVSLDLAVKDEPRSFLHLCRKYAGGVPHQVLLDELCRVGAATRLEGEYVRLENRTYLPAPLDPAGLERLGNVVNYFIDTVDHNLQKTKQGGGRFERYAITMSGLSVNGMSAFDSLIRERGQKFLEEIDDWLGENEVKPGIEIIEGDAVRTGIGIFHFVDKAGDYPRD
jgi:Family of unknown function (DUF6502)